MKIDFIIAANGNSTRFGSNKLIFKLNNKKTVLETIVKKILKIKVFNKIIIVCNNKHLFKNRVFKNNKIIFCNGGKTRGESIYRGFLQSDSDYMFVHDGARPFFTKNLIFALLNEIKSYDIIVPILRIHDSLKKESKEEIITKNRNSYFCTQTPQVIKTSVYKKIIETEKNFNFEDELDLYLKNTNSYKINLIKGEFNNYKLTYEIYK